MAIKAIINNTEKEIEQIKNSNEQDIDYVYSRIGDTEVEGEPSISIKSIGGELADYRIYGNMVGGESVGDLVESGEHAGEYRVPVTISRKAKHTATLQLHDCLPSVMQFDNQEALYYAENGLTAGTYNFTIQDSYDTSHGGGKTYQFTLANDVPAGGQLVFDWDEYTQASAAKITSYASSTSTTAIEQVGVTKGSGGTSLGTTDGNSTNVNHIQRARYGSNNYKESAIRQFLNSSAVAGSVWTPQTKYDRPPSWNSNTAGFMKDIDSDFLAVLGASPKVVSLNTVTDGGGSVTINNDKFFLLSLSEVYGGKENNINEGEPYPYYSNYSDLSAASKGNDSNRIKYRSGTAQVWWLRSPRSDYGNFVHSVYRSGDVYINDIAHDSCGVAPACNIELDENYAYNGQVLHVRDKITVTKGNDTLVFDVIGIDHDDVDFDVTATNLYLPEPIKMIGDEAEYIDYAEQKMHRVRKNLLNDKLSLNATLSTLSSEPPTLGFPQSIGENRRTYFLTVTPGEQYTISMSTPGDRLGICGYYNIVDPHEYTTENKLISDVVILPIMLTSVPSTYTFTVPNNVVMVAIYYSLSTRPIQIQIEKGSTATPYEPYIENTEVDVTLPALSTIKGTNTFSVGTSIQPSNIYIKDNFNYKKVFTATRTIEDELPLSYRSIEDNDSTLSNYRIYGNTVGGESVGDRTGNLFDMKKFAETAYPVNATVNYSENSLIFTATQVDAYVNQVYSQMNIPTALRSSCINVHPLTTYTISMNAPYKCYISWINDSFYPVDSYTTIPNNQSSYTFTTPSNCTKLLIRLGKEVNNIGDEFTISNIMLNTGSTALPYEPYGYKVPVTVEGKNLLQNTAISRTLSTGITVTVNDNKSMVINGTSNTGNASGIVLGGNVILDKGAYILSGCPQGGSSDTYKLICIFDDDGERKVLTDIGDGATIVLNGDNPKVINNGFYIYALSCDNNVFFPMLRKADITDDTYEPYHAPITTPIYLPEQIKKVGSEAEYVDYKEQKQHRVRKNLLQNIATSQTIRGVTFTVNSDGSIVCDGQASPSTATLIFSNFLVPSGTYILTGCPNGGSERGTYKMLLFINGAWFANDMGSGANFTLTETSTVSVRIDIYNGYTCDNLTFYPMLRLASIEDDTYEPYIEDTEVDVTLPALPTLSGTNTLSVGTEVQPSDIYLKGKIKKKPKIYYKIYYYSQDGQTALSTETVEEGHDCTYSTVPTKESDTDFDYTFTGWSTSTNSTTATAGATENIQQNTNLYAAFSKSFKTDTISDSWEEIIANCDNGTYASKYQIGDLKTIDVGTEGPVQMQIVAIDTDLLASDNTKKAPITWISKQLLKTYKAMNDTSTNYLSDWTNCDMRTYLKNTVLPMLPSVVQNNIKEVTKYTNQRTGSITFTTISSTEDIWLPSYREISNTTLYCETSGVQYNSIFTDNASQVKSKVGGSAYYWWTRSASGNSYSDCSCYFAYVGNYGRADYYGNRCTISRGVAIGFCT